MTCKDNFVLLVKAPKENEQEDKYVQLLKNVKFKVEILKSLDFNFINLNELLNKLNAPEQYSGLIFTSPRCVEAVRLALGLNVLNKIWQHKDNYVVGESTKNIAQVSLNLTCKGQESGNAENLSAFIIADLTNKDKPLLVPHGNFKTNTLSVNLTNGDVKLDELTVYDSILNENVEKDFMNITNNFKNVPSFIVFFSPSAVQCFANLFEKINKFTDIKIISIGLSTRKELENHHQIVHGVCQKPTAENVLELIQNFS